MMPTDDTTVELMLRGEIDQLESPRLRAEIHRGMITPIREQRVFQTGSGGAEGDLWLFFIVASGKVALAYSDEGSHGSSELRWGLVFVDSDQYGDSGGWYNSFRDLVVDSGYFKLE